MHKFVGLAPPVKKVKADTVINKKLYKQTKQKRSPQESWKLEFKWLLIDEQESKWIRKGAQGDQH